MRLNEKKGTIFFSKLSVKFVEKEKLQRLFFDENICVRGALGSSALVRQLL